MTVASLSVDLLFQLRQSLTFQTSKSSPAPKPQLRNDPLRPLNHSLRMGMELLPAQVVGVSTAKLGHHLLSGDRSVAQWLGRVMALSEATLMGGFEEEDVED